LYRTCTEFVLRIHGTYIRTYIRGPRASRPEAFGPTDLRLFPKTAVSSARAFFFFIFSSIWHSMDGVLCPTRWLVPFQSQLGAIARPKRGRSNPSQMHIRCQNSQTAGRFAHVSSPFGELGNTWQSKPFQQATQTAAGGLVGLSLDQTTQTLCSGRQLIIFKQRSSSAQQTH